jgi:hypothetical protein
MEIKYRFTKDSAKAFAEDVLTDTFRALDNGEEPESIIITVGNRSITLPMFAEIYEELTTFFKKALETEE